MTRPMSEEREKLEPCPFCDRQMTLRPDGYYRHAFQRRGPLCVAEFVAVLAGDPVSAEKWNRRSTSSAEREMREAWQPIETAPKQKVVLLWALTDTETGNWLMATGYWMPGYGDDPGAWTWDGRRLKAYDTQPTHWQPLPEPPAAIEKAPKP